MIKKQQVSGAFSSSAHRYEEYAELQKTVADELSNFVKKHISDGDDILDIGCGTGFLAANLSNKYNMLQLDISPAMCLYAARYGKVICGDFDNIGDINQHVISSMAIQWSADVESLINNIYQKLKQGCCFIFALLNDESLQDIDYINNLPPKSQHKNIIEQYDISYPLEFNSHFDLIRYLRNIGASSSENKLDISRRNELKQTVSTIWNVQYVCIKK